MFKRSIETINRLAEQYSKDSRTRIAYLRVFKVILYVNKISRKVNKDGYSTIHHGVFKDISKRKYVDILKDLIDNNVIHVNIPLSKSNLGIGAYDQVHIIRGYRLSGQWIHSMGLNNCDFKPLYESIPVDIPDHIRTQARHVMSSIPREFTVPHVEIMKDGLYNSIGVYDLLKLDLEGVQMTDEVMEDIAKWNAHKQAEQSGNRVFGWFHSLRSSFREHITYNGEHLTQALDIHSCVLTMIGKMLQGHVGIPVEEIGKWQCLCRKGKFYQAVMEGIGSDERKQVKTMIQVWLNCSKENESYWRARHIPLYKGISKWFHCNFPVISGIIDNYRIEYLESRGKVSRMVWYDYQKIEFDVIGRLQKALYQKYGVITWSVHDAVYSTPSQISRVPDIESLIWDIIDYRHFNKDDAEL